MTDVDNTIYGIIAMPVFVIDLMSGVIYSPLIIKLTEAWRARDLKNFCTDFGNNCIDFNLYRRSIFAWRSGFVVGIQSGYFFI